MKILRNIIALLFAAGTIAAAPATQPATLTVTKGGNYPVGNASAIVIGDTDGKPFIFHDGTLAGPGTLISQTTTKPVDVTVYNCTFNGKPPYRAIELYHIARFDGEHNALNNNGGVLIQDGHGVTTSVIWYANRGNNISGATSATTCNKTSFFQAYQVHCQGLIAWNHLEDAAGKSATEDCISMEESGGASAAAPMVIANNFVNGQYAYPMNHASTGSGIMLFDPSGSFGVTVGGYTRCYSNLVINIGNQAIVSAGGHDIEAFNNYVGNDGTNAQASYGLQHFNWDDKTPSSVFGKNVAYHDNQIGMKLGPAKSIAAPATDADNLTVHYLPTDQVTAKWTQMCAANHVCVGPLPSGMAFVPQVIAVIAPATQPSK